MQIEDRLIHYLRSLLRWRAVPLNVLMAWLNNRARGSVAVTLAFVIPLFSGIDQVRLWWLLAAVLVSLGQTPSTQEVERTVVIS